MKRNPDLDNVRLMANLLIVILHSSAACQYCSDDRLGVLVWTVLCSLLSAGALPALFLLSGYLLFYDYEFSNVGTKLTRRVRRLLVPYVSWNLVFVAFYLLMAPFVPRIQARVCSFGLNTFSGVCAKTFGFLTAPIDGPLWYLRAVFVFSLVSPIVLFVWRVSRQMRNGYMRIILGGLPFVVVGIAYAFTLRSGLRDGMALTYPFPSLLLFLVGGGLAFMKRDLVTPFVSRWGRMSAAIGLGFNFVISSRCVTCWIGFHDLAMLLCAPILFLAIPGLRRLFSGSLVSGFLRDGSFFLYCGHFLFCSIILHAVAPMLPIFPDRVFVLVGLFVFVGGGLTMVAYRLLWRLFPRLLSPLYGTF